ncbi:MAG: DUF1553 domain-containing protein, partial [Pirellulaceae bacterium]|nr:DUF1553 domain-containing protein [Pirellulaceae bacterium]
GGVDFQREVRPLLADRCFRCHGPDAAARQAGLRLDTAEDATRAADSGEAAIVPRRPDTSELIRRVTSDDPDQRMPPPDEGSPLAPAEVETLRRWIAAGAPYARHWAFDRPRAAAPPHVRQRDWPRNMVDLYVLNRLEQAGLPPSPPAEPSRLLRRLSLDLTGLPPTPAQLDHFEQAYAADPEPAYLREVERLLSSPHFGERLAAVWLDAARYADTNGYFGDKPRQAWPWRDWVLQALNANLPFDRFTIQQLAGDLLPGATRADRVATGFHRNSMANNETGTIDEEYRVEAVNDRVETTGTVWLGMTIGCAQCHDHKFDPVSQREYYQLFAFFNHSVEGGLVTRDNPPPTFEVPTPAQEQLVRQRRAELEAAERAYRAATATLDQQIAAWEPGALRGLPPLADDAIVRYDFENSVEAGHEVPAPLARERGIAGQAARFDGSSHVELSSPWDADQPWSVSLWTRPTGSLGCLWSRIEPQGRRRGVELLWQKGRLRVHLVHRWGADEIVATSRDALPSGDWHHVLLAYDGSRQGAGLRLTIDGHPATLDIQRDTLTGSVQSDEPLRIGRRDAGLGYEGLLDEFCLLPRAVSGEQSTGWADSQRLRGLVAQPSGERTTGERQWLRDYYLRRHAPPETRDAWQRWQQADQRLRTAEAAVPATLVMQERTERRSTRILVRGQYDQPAEEVQAGVPAIFPPLPADGDRDRLALARWLVSPEHPLAARVAVNRLWQLCFGEGLVRTPNDFGTQGELPTHPELLDALAVRLVERGWDTKDLLRLIVGSATYRQSSRATAELPERDPDNRLLARGARFRLPAELLRDQALAVSGLLVPRIGGPSVKPYQPAGLWEDVSYNAEESYVPDTGEGLWRRSLYTYWKRQAPPPALLLFDAPTREKCAVGRSRTNTPLQALVTLNDVTFHAAARELARDALAESTSDEVRLQTLFRRVVSRRPDAAESQVLLDLLARHRTADKSSLLAAWTLVAHTILNLDETLTRR